MLACAALLLSACQDDDENNTVSSSVNTPTPNNSNVTFINFTLDGQAYSYTTASENFEGVIGASTSSGPIFCGDYSSSIIRVDGTGLQPDISVINNCTPAENMGSEWFETLFFTGQQELPLEDQEAGWAFTIYDPQAPSPRSSKFVVQPESSQITITSVTETTVLFNNYIIVEGTFQCDIQSGSGGVVTNGSFRLPFEY